MIEVIVYFISIILMQISILYLFGKLVKKKLRIDFKYIILFNVICILQIILYINNLVIFGTLFTIVYSYFLFKKIYLSSTEEAKNYSIIIWTIALLIDVFVMLVINKFGLLNFY